MRIVFGQSIHNIWPQRGNTSIMDGSFSGIFFCFVLLSFVINFDGVIIITRPLSLLRRRVWGPKRFRSIRCKISQQAQSSMNLKFLHIGIFCNRLDERFAFVVCLIVRLLFVVLSIVCRCFSDSQPMFYRELYTGRRDIRNTLTHSLDTFCHMTWISHQGTPPGPS